MVLFLRDNLNRTIFEDVCCTKKKGLVDEVERLQKCTVTRRTLGLCNEQNLEPQYQEACKSCYGVYPVGVDHICPD